MVTTGKPIASLRWWIGGLLFASTVINYIDRQTLSLLAPYLKLDYHWTNSDYADIAIAFRVAYSIGQTVFGRLMDRIGTRRGLTFTVTWYSVASILTSLASGFFDSGSSIGAAVAPFIVLGIYFRWGWRPAFMIPGILGFLWLIVWRWLYYPPEEHGRIGRAELEMIVADKQESAAPQEGKSRPRWSDLLKLPQTWGVIIAKASTDPVYFFIAEWFPIYLVAKGIELRSGLIAVWIPFIAADLGSFFAGGASGYLIKRGWPLGAARKALIVFGGVGMTTLIPTIFTTNLYLIALLFAVATFTYAGFTTMANVLPSDLYNSESVASVSGLSGTGAGIGTIVAFKLIGYFSDARQATGTHSFDPIVIIAGLVPFAGMILVLLLVRNTRATNQGLVRRI
jgi:ACS family hexuronate transporter-like MFS transporter